MQNDCSVDCCLHGAVQKCTNSLFRTHSLKSEFSGQYRALVSPRLSLGV